MATYLRHSLPRLYAQIMKQTGFLDKFATERHPISLYERLYCIEHNVIDRPKCQMCKKNYVRKFIKQQDCYSKWCSAHCQASDPECLTKSKQTRKEKYGDENFNNVSQRTDTLKAKTEEDPQYWERRVKKTKQTKLERYGDESYVNAGKARQTMHQHMLENPDFWKEREERTAQTKMKNGHGPKWNNREKAKQTCLANYGVEWFSMSDEWHAIMEGIRINDPEFYARQVQKRNETISSIPDFYAVRGRKTKTTCIDKYGVASTLQLDKCRSNRIDADMKRKMLYLAECEYDEPLFGIDDLRKNYKDKNHKYKFKCKSCGKTFFAELKWVFGKHHHCTKCYPKGRSICEKQLLDYIVSIWKDPNEVHYNSRSFIPPYELDIMVNNSSLKTAFEYNGLYWHSSDIKFKSESKEENDRRKQLHLDKLNLCLENRIRLVTIFEDEWLVDQNLVKSKISSILGLSPVVDGKDCNVKIYGHEISLTDKHSSQTVATAKFSRSRFNISEEWELISYETTQFITVKDGIQRIMNAFQQEFNPKSIAVFVDRRWDDGHEYVQCGFSLAKVIPPKCWWFSKRSLHRYNEIDFKKNIANDVLHEKFINSYEQQCKLIELGWMRVYDCGYLKFVKIF